MYQFLTDYDRRLLRPFHFNVGHWQIIVTPRWWWRPSWGHENRGSRMAWWQANLGPLSVRRYRMVHLGYGIVR